MKHARPVQLKPAGALLPLGVTPYLILLNLYSGFLAVIYWGIAAM